MLFNYLNMFYANEGQTVKISVHQPSLKTQHNRPPILKLQASKDISKPVFPETSCKISFCSHQYEDISNIVQQLLTDVCLRVSQTRAPSHFIGLKWSSCSECLVCVTGNAGSTIWAQGHWAGERLARWDLQRWTQTNPWPGDTVVRCVLCPVGGDNRLFDSPALGREQLNREEEEHVGIGPLTADWADTSSEHGHVCLEEHVLHLETSVWTVVSMPPH